jgi:hypothetical protein
MVELKENEGGAEGVAGASGRKKRGAGWGAGGPLLGAMEGCGGSAPNIASGDPLGVPVKVAYVFGHHNWSRSIMTVRLRFHIASSSPVVCRLVSNQHFNGACEGVVFFFGPLW